MAWSGVGIDVGKKIPSPRAISDAVDRTLSDGTYRAAAQRLSREFAAAPGADGLAADVEAMIAARAVQAG